MERAKSFNSSLSCHYLRTNGLFYLTTVKAGFGRAGVLSRPCIENEEFLATAQMKTLKGVSP
ncbi:hypothetical protein GALMADRAFT_242470 [Galerina marginata CBS 339.88]|uniref:Uncharacterized protein n=1 Tax=Galerina marginata (strain CBS 339.88) TaxID=685588 RepID=A0A067TAL0_GALM3|nr:hypothetical protein GALMADRAFT_242470 [Galerina marginata CBS 339.88]